MTIFISYPSEDEAIARTVHTALRSIVAERRIFFGAVSLRGADEYESVLAEQIEKTELFILIYCGSARLKDMSWCFYEAGQFRAQLQRSVGTTGASAELSRRLTYLYDGVRPPVLSRFQGVPVNAIKVTANHDDEVEDTQLFRFCLDIMKQFAPDRDASDSHNRRMLKNEVRNIASAFASNVPAPEREKALLPRLRFELRAGNGRATFDDGTQVHDDVDGNALNDIFGIVDKKTSWGAIKEKAAAKYGFLPPALGDVEIAIQKLARGDSPNQTQGLVLANNMLFRPILSRYTKYGNGDLTCHLGFVPTRQKGFELGAKSSVLLIGIIFTMRFRQKIFPLIRPIENLATNPPAESPIDRFRKQLLDIETEVAEYGLQSAHETDEDPLLVEFLEGPAKDYLRHQVELWRYSRRKMGQYFARADYRENTEFREFLLQELLRIRDENPKVLRLLINELRRMEKVGE
jgi:hypothetical protein